MKYTKLLSLFSVNATMYNVHNGSTSSLSLELVPRCRRPSAQMACSSWSPSALPHCISCILHCAPSHSLLCAELGSQALPAWPAWLWISVGGNRSLLALRYKCSWVWSGATVHSFGVPAIFAVQSLSCGGPQVFAHCLGLLRTEMLTCSKQRS